MRWRINNLPKVALQVIGEIFSTGPRVSISRSIVEAHGGQLLAEANVPHGAVFRFSVPLEELVS